MRKTVGATMLPKRMPAQNGGGAKIGEDVARDRPRHDCRRIAAAAVIHGSIAGLEMQTISVP
ncbi:hypothetical protein NKI56_09705 [Mesorhizobium sp. M0622]|uniref:hypothetical protein n=1 Tax=unclassified Mesorhizobium TaxID=325217 RepID=UPI00333D8BB5